MRVELGRAAADRAASAGGRRRWRAYCVAQLAGDGVAIALDFGAGGVDGLVEPFELVLDGIARDEPPRDAKSLVVHDQRFADGHAGRNGNPL